MEKLGGRSKTQGVVRNDAPIYEVGHQQAHNGTQHLPAMGKKAVIDRLQEGDVR